MNSNSNFDMTESNQSKFDEIDLRIYINFIFRNKRIISIISFSFFIISCFYALTIKRVWEGQFQIVVKNEDKSINSSNLINPTFSKILNSSKNNDLNTQVSILKSPSVLMPTFNFFVSNYLNNKKNELNFLNWRKNIKFELEEGTSVLNISFINENKESIIPVLEKISKSYQDYSGKKTKRNQELTKKYLIEQIDLFDKKSSESFKFAQDFGFDQDLLTIVSGGNSGETEFPKLLLNNAGIEIIRSNAANKIRKIDLQIKKLKEIGDDYSRVLYVALSIPELANDGLAKDLTRIENELIIQKVRYTSDDINILRLIEPRNLLIKLISEKALGFLEAKKVETEAVMLAASRPKGVLLKYKELLRQAERDETTLVFLENSLRRIELEESKEKDPWELITNPTLLDFPVGTSRKLIAMIGLLTGALVGSGFAFYREKQSGGFYDLGKLKEWFSLKFFEKIYTKDLTLKSESFLYIKEYIKSRNLKKVNLIFLGSSQKEILQKLKDKISEDIPSTIKIDLLSSLDKLNKSIGNDLNLLLLEEGNIKYSDIVSIKKYLTLSDNSLEGIILIN